MHLNVAVCCCVERFSIDSCETFKSTLVAWLSLTLVQELSSLESSCSLRRLAARRKSGQSFIHLLMNNWLKFNDSKHFLSLQIVGATLFASQNIPLQCVGALGTAKAWSCSCGMTVIPLCFCPGFRVFLASIQEVVSGCDQCGETFKVCFFNLSLW